MLVDDPSAVYVLLVCDSSVVHILLVYDSSVVYDLLVYDSGPVYDVLIDDASAVYVLGIPGYRFGTSSNEHTPRADTRGTGHFFPYKAAYMPTWFLGELGEGLDLRYNC